MYKFKTKYKSCFKAAIDELQYVRQGDSPPSPYLKIMRPRRKTGKL